MKHLDNIKSPTVPDWVRLPQNGTTCPHSGLNRSAMDKLVRAQQCNNFDPGHGLFRTEGARRTSQENLCSNEIAEPGHRDPAKRERRRIVAQGDQVQCAEGITRRERTRRGRD
jgi:hypothetical protein